MRFVTTGSPNAIAPAEGESWPTEVNFPSYPAKGWMS
jgi:hypothetical protein